MRIGVIAATAALAAGIVGATVLAGTGSASADETWRCKEGNVCLWKHADFVGLMVPAKKAEPGLDPAYFDDSASSLWNRTNRAWCFYAGYDYSGDKLRVPAGTKTFNLLSFNDRISSFKPC